MNCRYIILDGEAAPLRYPYAKGNAWFEQVLDGPGSVLGDPAAAEPAYFQQVELTSYAPNELRYHYTSNISSKLIFSEVYYPAGWTLKVEDTGEELPIELEGALLRAAFVPAGEHTLVMRFDPPSYRRGEALSRASSILLILAALGAILGAALPALRANSRKEGA